MSRIKKHFLERINALLTTLIALVGFSGNQAIKAQTIHHIMVKYGVPTATFHIQGTVTDDKKKPLPDVQVVIEKNNNANDTVHTNARGRFDSTAGRFPTDSATVTFVDPTGKHASNTEQVKIKYEKNDGWNKGQGKAKLKTKLQKQAQIVPEPKRMPEVMVMYGVRPAPYRELDKIPQPRPTDEKK